MPKLNTFIASLSIATMLTYPASAGQPVLSGAPIQYHGSTASAGHTTASVHSGYAAAQSGCGYATAPQYTQYAGSTCATGGASYHTGATNYVTTTSATAGYATHAVPSHVSTATSGFSMSGGSTYAAPAAASSSSIVCVLHGNEVPCASVPGLADALRGQGLSDIAAQLPQGSAATGSFAPSGPQIVSGAASAPNFIQTQTGQVINTQTGMVVSGAVSGNGFVPAAPVAPIAAPAPMPLYPVAAPISAPAQGYSAAVGQVSSGYGPYGTMYYGDPGTSWVTAAPVLSPCGQVIGYQCGSSRIQLSNGTAYALNGGVGAGIYGEFYGGGGTLIEGGSRFSGVLDARAASFSRTRTSTNNVNINNNVTINRPMPRTRNPRPHMRTNRPHNGGGKHGGGRHGGGKH